MRVLQREMYRREDAAALLPALGLPSPSEAQLRAAFKVFDVAGRGEALDAEYVREQLQILMPHAAALVWGTAPRQQPGCLAVHLRACHRMAVAASQRRVPVASSPVPAASRRRQQLRRRR